MSRKARTDKDLPSIEDVMMTVYSDRLVKFKVVGALLGCQTDKELLDYQTIYLNYQGPNKEDIAYLQLIYERWGNNEPITLNQERVLDDRIWKYRKQIVKLVAFGHVDKAEECFLSRFQDIWRGPTANA